jgi:Tol biopolymer transport system component
LTPIWQSPYSWAGSYVYFAIGTTVEGVNLFRARIDEKTWKFSGPAERITSGAGMQYGASALADGRLVYSSLVWVTNIWTLDAKPDQGLIDGEPVAVADDAMVKFRPSLSRDGTKLVYSASSGLQRPRSEVRLKDLVKGEEKVFPVWVAQINVNPRISPDGTVISYRIISGGKAKAFVFSEKEPAGREVCDCEILTFYTDPNFAVVWETDTRLARWNIATGEKTPLFESRSDEVIEPALSPDDRWLAFVLGKPDGRVAMCIAPLEGRSAPATEEDWIVFSEQDRYLGSPAWSPDGTHLYYLSESGGPCSIRVQKLDPGTKRPVGEGKTVYSPSRAHINLNMPKGNGTLAVGRDRLAVWGGGSTGNIYMATPKKI